VKLCAEDIEPHKHSLGLGQSFYACLTKAKKNYGYNATYCVHVRSVHPLLQDALVDIAHQHVDVFQRPYALQNGRVLEPLHLGPFHFFSRLVAELSFHEALYDPSPLYRQRAHLIDR